MANLSELRSRVVAKLGLDATEDQTLLDSWLNEGVEDILVKTRCKVSPGTMTTTADQADYELDTDILRLLDMYITSGGQDWRFERTTVQEILDMRRITPSLSSPTRFYALAGANLLMLYPTPTSVETITIYYVPRPTALSATGDSPTSIPSEFHKLVEWYALAEGGDFDDDGSSLNGDRYRAMYEDGLRKFRRSIALKGGTRLAPARVGRRTRRPVANTNDIDIF